MVDSKLTSQRIEDLQRQVASLKDELEQAHRQLVEAEKMASLGEMAAGIAHEIRNPLDFVGNFAALTEELLFELDEAVAGDEAVRELIADLKRNASVIVQHTKRADRIVGALMQHAGSRPGRHEPTDVNALVDEFLRISYQGRQSLHENFHCDVHRDYDDGIGRMLLNRHEMGRALLNIFGNAFDATEERAAGGEADYEPRISLSTRLDDGHVVISISDNGPGIPADVLEHVFEPFFTTKQAGAGTGLGLSVSHDIVTGGHSGTIAVESKEGSGTTIRIRLPKPQKPD